MLSTAGASVEEEEVKASSNGKVSLLDIMKVCFPWTPTRVLQERCMHAMREEEDGLKEEVRRSCHERRLSREQQAIVHALFALADEQGNNKVDLPTLQQVPSSCSSFAAAASPPPPPDPLLSRPSLPPAPCAPAVHELV